MHESVLSTKSRRGKAACAWKCLQDFWIPVIQITQSMKENLAFWTEVVMTLGLDIPTQGSQNILPNLGTVMLLPTAETQL